MRLTRVGRRKPYTERGIGRVPCARCGCPSTQQWSICALDNRYVGTCERCDIMLNLFVLRFMRIPDTPTRIRRYRQRFEAPMIRVRA